MNSEKDWSSVMLEPNKIERFLGIVTTELRNNPRIANCEIKSLCGAIVRRTIRARIG